MMKKLFVICISLILVLSSFSLCFADQVFFIDPSTGNIVNTDETAAEAISGEVNLTSGCSYDKTEKMYIYSTESLSGAHVRSSIYDGMITTDSVKITVDEGAMVSVYFEGEVLESAALSDISDPGVYIVRDDSSDRELFRFTITNKVTGNFKAYVVPDIFYVVSVTFNGAEVGQVGNEVNLEQDGEYKIVYANDAVSKKYSLELEVDHTPPVLLISGVNEKGIANSTVRFGETEDNSTLEIIRDDEIIVQSKELKDAGYYVINYTDEAGNSVVYTFQIHFFLDAGGWIYVGLLAMIAAAAIFYYFYSRKHLKIC